jgi:uncharacterized protein YeaO (DUF488 family)
MIYTARIGAKDIIGRVVDITVKNSKGHCFAPTWELVMSFKKGRISWAIYEERYRELIFQRTKTRWEEFLLLIEQIKVEDITFVCFCVNEAYCHRRVAKEILLELSQTE